METRGRTNAERGMKVWLLITSGEKVVDKFRTKKMAKEMQEYYLKNYGWSLEIKRETKFKEWIKKIVK